MSTVEKYASDALLWMSMYGERERFDQKLGNWSAFQSAVVSWRLGGSLYLQSHSGHVNDDPSKKAESPDTRTLSPVICRIPHPHLLR